MRTVQATDEGVVEVSYMWLPTFIGINKKLQEELELALKDRAEGRDLTEEFLDELDDMVISFIEKKFPICTGIREFLDGLKYINLG